MCGADRCRVVSYFILLFGVLPLRAAIAVGRDVFRPDANTLVELLMRIQSSSPFCHFVIFCLSLMEYADSPTDPGDTLLNHYLIATWAKICQAMGHEFEPYLPVVMPPLVNAASTKADISVYGRR
jgi:importin-5